MLALYLFFAAGKVVTAVLVSTVDGVASAPPRKSVTAYPGTYMLFNNIMNTMQPQEGATITRVSARNRTVSKNCIIVGPDTYMASNTAA